MADDKVLSEDDDIDIVEVEQLPKPGETAVVETPDPDEDADDKGDEEDARLVADDDDDDDDNPSDKDTPAHKKRVNRRKLQKEARDRTIARLAAAEERNADLARRLAAVEGNVLTQNETQVDERLTKVRDDIAVADRILAAALEAGNGADFVAAQNMRDTAKAMETDLLRNKSTFTERKTAQPDAKVAELSSGWKTANSVWYGVNPEATQVANQIDAQVAADGYDPKTPAYWQELSRRLQSRFQSAAETNGAAPPKKKTPPPQGQAREHVPASTRSQVFVTAERKQALIDKGVWDDPVERKRYLKAYEKYDREEAERAR